jgi:hypothetical protein
MLSAIKYDQARQAVALCLLSMNALGAASAGSAIYGKNLQRV